MRVPSLPPSFNARGCPISRHVAHLRPRPPRPSQALPFGSGVQRRAPSCAGKSKVSDIVTRDTPGDQGSRLGGEGEKAGARNLGRHHALRGQRHGRLDAPGVAPDLRVRVRPRRAAAGERLLARVPLGLTGLPADSRCHGPRAALPRAPEYECPGWNGPPATCTSMTAKWCR